MKELAARPLSLRNLELFWAQGQALPIPMCIGIGIRLPRSFRSTLSRFLAASGCFDGAAMFFRAPNASKRGFSGAKRAKTMFFRAQTGRKRCFFERKPGANGVIR